MKTYIEFYRDDKDYSIGTDAVRKLDGRMTINNLVNIITTSNYWKNYAKNLSYNRFRLFKVENLRDEWNYVTDFISI